MRQQAMICPTILMAVLLSCGPSSTAQLEENKEVARRFIEAVNNGDYDALDELMMPDFVRHSQATSDIEIRSREEFKRFDEEYKATFPDAKITVHFVLAEGDKLGAYMTFTGTQEGEMGPFPPSGRTVESKFLGIMRLDGGKIAEMWVEWDNLAMLAQLGHFPPVGTEQ
jgi:steroid delta-isomerase-like uncharacterized protein